MPEIYVSSNGDRWDLLSDSATGHAFVRHTANQASSGNVVDLSLPAFLELNRGGPEHQALWSMIGTLVGNGGIVPGSHQPSAPDVGAAAAEPSPSEPGYG